MASKIVFKVNRKGIRDHAKGPEVLALVLAVGEEAKAAAVALAQPIRKTGNYESSFGVRPEMLTIARLRRHIAVVENTSPHAAAVEWGRYGRAPGTGQSAHHIFGRTLDAMAAKAGLTRGAR